MEPTHRREWEDRALKGREASDTLQDPGFRASVALTRARLYEDWVNSSSVREREELHSESRALGRLLESLEYIHQDGLVVQEALRRAGEET